MKSALGGRARMLDPDEVSTLTGHPVGGVCPSGLATALPMLCDVSLRAFATVFPAAGSQTSSIEVAPERLATLVGARWVDIATPACQRVSSLTPELPQPSRHLRLSLQPLCVEIEGLGSTVMSLPKACAKLDDDQPAPRPHPGRLRSAPVACAAAHARRSARSAWRRSCRPSGCVGCQPTRFRPRALRPWRNGALRP